MQFLPEIMMFTADKKLCSWLCSQTDMTAEDWELFTEPNSNEGVPVR